MGVNSKCRVFDNDIHWSMKFSGAVTMNRDNGTLVGQTSVLVLTLDRAVPSGHAH